MNFKLSKSNNDCEWDELVDESPQGTIFLKSLYLKALASPLSCYVVTTLGGEILAGVAVMESLDFCMQQAPFPYTPYQGIFFSSKTSSLVQHKRVTSEFRVTEFIIRSLIDIYGNFNMSLSPIFEDIRPFLWHSYGQVEEPHFLIQNRYTATLDLSNFQLDSYLKTVRTVRRQEYNKSVAKISETDDISLFMDIYIATFKRQDIQLTNSQISLVERICHAALAHGFGRLSMAKTEEGVASMALFVYDKRCSYYLFGANDPSQRKSGASTKLMIDNIIKMAEKGIPKMDFVGANSPNRGDFKISFNSRLVPYYEMSLCSSVEK